MFNPYYIPLATLLPPVKETTKVHHVRKPAIPRCKSIKFRATFPKAESYGLHQVKEVVFALGLGPCGKHVLKLTHTVTDDLLTIVQTSRAPDDLEEPTEGLQAMLKLERHDQAVRMQRPPRLVPKLGETVTIGWWIFKTTHTPMVMGFEEQEPHKDILSPEEIATLNEARRAYWLAYGEWQERLEVKTFVYKMSDVHGRIEVIQ